MGYSPAKYLPDQRQQYYVYNLGISGDNTITLSEEVEAKSRKPISHLCYRNNDILSIPQTVCVLSPDDFGKNPQNCFLYKFTDKVVFVGLTGWTKTKTVPIPWSTDKSIRRKYQADG